MPAPDMLDAAIRRGMERARRRRRWRRRLAVSACMAVLAAFVTAVKLSPGFALAMSKIPVLSGLVWILEQDPGIRLALEHDYYQPLGLAAELDGYRLAVDGLVADEGRMVLFYTETGGRMGGVRLLDADGNGLVASISLADPIPVGGSREETGPRLNAIDVNMGTGRVIPDLVVLEAEGPAGGLLRLDIPVDRNRFAGMTETYEVDAAVSVEGQRFTVQKAVLTPVRISVHIVPDPENEKRIFRFHDLRLRLDGGEEVGWFTANGPDEAGRFVFHFPSPYFRRPASISLVGEHLGALDRDDMAISISLAERRIVKAPSDRVKLKSIEQTGDDWLITLEMTEFAEWDRWGYVLVDPWGYFSDGSGRTYKAEGQNGNSLWAESGPNGTVEMRQVLDFRIPASDAYEDPLTFPLLDYPAYISEPFSVRIK